MKTKGRVLLVEDQQDFRERVARRLTKIGFRVEPYGDCAQAVEAFSPGEFDAVITDWQLHHDRGDQLLAEIRRRDWEVPLILISGKLGDDARRAASLERILEAGSSRFVEKGSSSFDPIVDALEDLLQRRDSAVVDLIRQWRVSKRSVRTTSGDLTPRGVLDLALGSPISDLKALTTGVAEDFAKWERARLRKRGRPRSS